MEANDTSVETKTHPIAEQFGKMILATAASFIAAKLTEKAFDTILEKRRSKPAEIQQ